jgi:beta-glucosidase
VTSFPSDFLWGTAASAHQVEGDCTNNNWTYFEGLNDPSGRPRIRHGHRAGKTCEQWTRFREDIALMRSFGLNAYRFSVEWSKIEPEEGRFNEAALAHYEEMVDALLAAGVEPVITLHHFTDPIWFSDAGGFLREDSPEILCRFAQKVFDRLAPRVRIWCTVNEPAVYAVSGYITGEFPPAVRNPSQAARVLANLLRAHALIYSTCKEQHADTQIGLPTNVFFYEPAARWNPLDRIAAYCADRNFNHGILDYLLTGRFSLSIPGVVRLDVNHGMQESFDFIGVNYYTRFHLRFNPWSTDKVIPVSRMPLERLTDMGWEIYPEGILRALRLVASYTRKPILITENGIADDSDTKRSQYITEHLCRVKDARGEGIDVRGYFFWTLLDNFEWAHGYTKRFGLYHVDFATQERSLRAGSTAYQDFIKGSVVCK